MVVSVNVNIEGDSAPKLVPQFALAHFGDGGLRLRVEGGIRVPSLSVEKNKSKKIQFNNKASTFMPVAAL